MIQTPDCSTFQAFQNCGPGFGPHNKGHGICWCTDGPLNLNPKPLLLGSVMFVCVRVSVICFCRVGLGLLGHRREACGGFSQSAVSFRGSL